jgi:hypothetical protein
MDVPKKIAGFYVGVLQLDAPVKLGLLCDQLRGPGRDIEWGIEDGVRYVLQCRTITTGMPA